MSIIFLGCHQLFALAMAQSEASEVEGKRSRVKLAFFTYFIFYICAHIYVGPDIGVLFLQLKNKILNLSDGVIYSTLFFG